MSVSQIKQSQFGDVMNEQNLGKNSMKSTQNNIKFKFYCKTIISYKTLQVISTYGRDLGSMKTEKRGELEELVNKILKAQISFDIQDTHSSQLHNPSKVEELTFVSFLDDASDL